MTVRQESHVGRDPLPRGWVSTAVLVGLAGVVLAAYASIGRPLWIDEFVHFALGGLDPLEAMATIVGTTGPNVNQGQTGVYLFFDYWMMYVFGANLFMLRLPSLVSSALMLWAAVVFLRLKGYGPVWGALVILAFAAQGSFMYYAGEARPYMPLAAACVLTLAYFQFPMVERRTWIARTFGIVGILGGALSHPYYAVYGVLIAAFSLWDAGLLSRPRAGRKDILAFVNLRLVLPAVSLYVIVGLLTWAKGRPDDPLDPWYWFGGISGGVDAFVLAHVELLQAVQMPTAVALLAVVLTLSVVTWTAGGQVAAAPLVLIGLAVGTSLLITVASIVGAYWVFVRQWVAGMALVAVGLVWLLAATWTHGRRNRRIRQAVVGSLVVVTIASAGVNLVEQFTGIGVNLAYWDSLRSDPPARPVVLGRDPSNDEWVLLGNLDVAVGGSVSREVSDYYLRLKVEP
jgi:hypothetical protein